MAEERPEALAEFSETARKQPQQSETVKKPLTATEHTKPIPTDNAEKHDAATKVLQEGVTHEDKGAAEAIDKLPDRIVESRK